MNLKFPTDKEYPEGYEWFAYDFSGDAFWYKERPSLQGVQWYPESNKPSDCTEAAEYDLAYLIDDWKSTLRQKGQEGIKNDINKLDFTQVLNPDFLPTIEECCKILSQGAKKYSQDNWKHLDKSRLEKALLRHLMAYLSGEISDKESGQKHLSHVITNCLFLNWFENQKG